MNKDKKQSKIYYADRTIFSSGHPKGFKPTGYRININHPIIHPLFENYCRNHNVVRHEPLSDEQRLNFEAIIFAMIEAGIIRIVD